MTWQVDKNWHLLHLAQNPSHRSFKLTTYHSACAARKLRAGEEIIQLTTIIASQVIKIPYATFDSCNQHNVYVTYYN